MKDYGASLVWPEPPRALRETANKFEAMYERWRAYMVVKRVPPEVNYINTCILYYILYTVV